MKKTLAIVLTTSFLVAGCSTADKKDDMAMAVNTTPAVTQAKADLDHAIAAGAQWRLIDKATGSKAVDLSKLMKVAE
jgi:outer membrane murein-binding lipoprotein Lpp